MASTRFVPPETTLEAFIEEQANKNTLSKIKRDVSLLKEFIRVKGKEEEFENIEPREKHWTNILSSTTSTRRSLAIEEREDVSLSENQESPQQVLSLLRGANIHGETFNISADKQCKSAESKLVHAQREAPPLCDWIRQWLIGLEEVFSSLYFLIFVHLALFWMRRFFNT